MGFVAVIAVKPEEEKTNRIMETGESLMYKQPMGMMNCLLTTSQNENVLNAPVLTNRTAHNNGKKPFLDQTKLKAIKQLRRYKMAFFGNVEEERKTKRCTDLWWVLTQTQVTPHMQLETPGGAKGLMPLREESYSRVKA